LLVVQFCPYEQMQQKSLGQKLMSVWL